MTTRLPTPTVHQRSGVGIFPDADTPDRYDVAARLVDKPPPHPSIALIPRKSTIFRVGIKGVPGVWTCMTRREAIRLGISGSKIRFRVPQDAKWCRMISN